MILLWGDPADRPFGAVLREVARLGAPFVALTPQEVRTAAVRTSARSALDGELALAGRRVPLSAFTAAYLRPAMPAAAMPTADAAHEQRRLVETRQALLTWADLSAACVVNPPAAMAANNSKPFQGAQIRAAGFLTPRTLLTSSADDARAFAAECPVIFKSTSGVRSVVSQLRPEHEARLADLASCPTMFQERVEGVDHRVHVVAEETFACRVRSTADDYRYPSPSDGQPVLEAVALDAALARRVRDMVRGMGLRVAGVDLRRTPDGRWYCFEVNPSPAFSYYAGATGQPIAAAIARLLTAPPGA